MSILFGIYSISFFIITTFFTNTYSKNCTAKESLITHLPNFTDSDLPCMYSGFIQLDDSKYHSKIFYWLFQSIASNTSITSSPLLIYINGVEKSSLYTLFSEIGPLRINLKTGEFYYDKTEFSWINKASILYVDIPLGTGYSYTDNTKSIPNTSSTLSSQFYRFIQRFFIKHKDLIKSDFLIIGESHAGRYIPEISKLILEENDNIDEGISHNLKINLKKIAIGNGLFDLRYQIPARSSLIKGLGIVSEYDEEPQLDALLRNCDFELTKPQSDSFKGQCHKPLQFIDELAGDVSEFDIRKSKYTDLLLINTLNEYLNREDVVFALHVKNNTIKNQPYWSLFNQTVLSALNNDIIIGSAIPALETVLNKWSNIQFILYAGQFDLIYGPQGIEDILRNLNFKNSEFWRNAPRELWKINISPAGYEDEFVVAGYVKQYENIIFITMRNAGQFAPKDRPGSSFDLLKYMLSDEKNWSCPDIINNCSLTAKKCEAMNHCTNNGECNLSTGGKCKCINEYLGPDCSYRAELLQGDQKETKLSPQMIKVYNLSHFDNDIFLKLESDSGGILLSLLDKDEHEFIFNMEKHLMTFKKTNKNSLEMYLDKQLLIHNLFIINNLNYQDDIKFRILINSFGSYRSSFWSPGGFGFFLTVFSLILGLSLFVASYYLYRRYLQDKRNSSREITIEQGLISSLRA